MSRYIFFFGVLLLTSLLLTSCDHFWSIWLYNTSDKDVYIVLDFDTQDDCVSADSQRQLLEAHSDFHFSHFDYWEELIQDSVHFYFIDATKIELPSILLTKEECEIITNEMILERQTIHREDLAKDEYIQAVLYFPSE